MLNIINIGHGPRGGKAVLLYFQDHRQHQAIGVIMRFGLAVMKFTERLVEYHQGPTSAAPIYKRGRARDTHQG